jgi:hypothetical protein
LLFVALLLGFIVVVAAFAYGVPRVSVFVYRLANPVAGGMFLLDLIVLPLAVSRRTRPTVGAVLQLSSYVFGMVLWTFSAMVAFSYWGYFGLFFGLVWMGIGVVPVALLAAALNASWLIVIGIVGEFLCVFGARVLAARLSASPL